MAKKNLSSVLGIDIGSQSIKVVELKQTGKEFAVSAVGMVQTPNGLVDHTGVYDTDTIGPMIKQLCTNIGATVGQCVLSISGQASILVRTLEVPKVSPNELKQTMEWEISRNIPFAESTVVSDYKAFPSTDPNSMNMDVVMAIAPQSAVDTLMGIGKKAGKQVHAIDVEPLSMARILKSGYDAELRGETVCVIEVGHKSTAINMYRDGQLLMPRQVPVGGEAFTSAVASGMGVGVEDAERMKIEQAEVPDAPAAAGFGLDATQGMGTFNPFEDFVLPANPFAEPAPAPDYSAPADSGSIYDYSAPAPAASDSDPGDLPPTYASPFADDTPAAPSYDAAPAPAPAVNPVYQAMSGEVDEFVAEVRRSVDYFRSRGGDVARVLVCGGGSNLKGLATLIERSVGVRSELMDPFKGMAITAKKIEYGVLENHRADFAVAVGNALHIAFD